MPTIRTWLFTLTCVLYTYRLCCLNCFNRYVSVPGANTGNIPSQEMTLESWVKVSKGHRWGGIIGFFVRFVCSVVLCSRAVAHSHPPHPAVCRLQRRCARYGGNAKHSNNHQQYVAPRPTNPLHLPPHPPRAPPHPSCRIQQDNGSYEKGWVLTYHTTQMGVAVATTSNGRLESYLYVHSHTRRSS